MDQLLLALDGFLEAVRKVGKVRALRPVERKLEKRMQAAFTAQGKLFVQALASVKGQFPIEESVGEDDWGPLFDQAVSKTIDLFSGAIGEAAEEALLAGARVAIADLELGISFSLKNPRALAYVRTVGADKVTRINDTTRAVVKALIEQAVGEGWSYNRTARAIIERFREFAVGKPQEHIASRAHLVAVTEAGDAYEAGNFMPIQDLMGAGIEMEKAWDTMGDAKVSDGCLANEAEGWIPADQLHASGHLHPLRFPGCRCAEKYRRKQDIAKRLVEYADDQPRDSKGRWTSTGGGDKAEDPAATTSPEIHTVGHMRDMRSLYPKSEPGREHMRELDVVASKRVRKHLEMAGEDREGLLAARSADIADLIHKPDIVYDKLDYSEEGHFRQVFARARPDADGKHLAVVISLAQLPSQPRSEYHEVITVFRAKHEYFYRSQGKREVLKSKWKAITKQKAGR